MKSEYRIWIRYINFVGMELFDDYEPIRRRHRTIVSELAWALDIIPEIPCSACGKNMKFLGGSMAFSCECGGSIMVLATDDIVMKWHMEHWKDLSPPQTEEDILLYGRDKGVPLEIEEWGGQK